MNTFFVSVIIPTYKDWPRLKLCLEALANQTYPLDNFEVIVVNNDPEESCPYELPATNMKIIAEAKPGSYAARNAGIKIVQGEILAFTDSDCIPDEHWLEEGQKSLSTSCHEKTIISGAIKLFFVNPKKPSVAEVYEKEFGFFQNLLKYSSKPILNSMITANVFLSSKTFHDVGYFDDQLMSGGDTEFSYRALKRGCKIIFGTNVVVKHPARNSINELLRKQRRIFGGRVFKLINSGNRKFNSLLHVITSLYKIFLKRILSIATGKRKTSLKDGTKCIIILILIMFSLLYEFLFILIKNKARRT